MEIISSVWRRGRYLSFGFDSDPASPSKEFGLKTLHDPPGAEVDVVFVHGLYGDRLQTWTSSNGVLWPRDLLPLDVPTARILTYGYNGKPSDASYLARVTLYHGADELLDALHKVRGSPQLERRPLIFVCHSFGGWLVKSLLVRAVNSKRVRSEADDIYKATAGVIFFGTPHRIKDGDHWDKAVQGIFSSDGDNNLVLKPLLEELKWLSVQLDQYKSVSGSISNVFFYETKETPIKSPLTMLIVSEEIAAPLSLRRIESTVIGLNANHFDMVKFASSRDENYRVFLSTLQATLTDIHKKVSEYFDLSQSKISLHSDQIVQIARNLKVTVLPKGLSETKFVGQVQPLRNLHELLQRARGSGNPRQIITVCGPSGAGKTALVRKYAQEHRSKFSHLIWLDARSVRSLKRSFLTALNTLFEDFVRLSAESSLSRANISRWLGLEGELEENLPLSSPPRHQLDRDYHHGQSPFQDLHDFATEAFKEFLDRSIMKRWLLVFDGFRGTFEISSFIPETANGQIILIKTSQNLRTDRYTMSLSGMQEEESALQLLALSSEADANKWTIDDLDSAKSILQKTGDLPAAIRMNGFALRASSMSLQDFASLLARQYRGASAMAGWFDSYFTNQSSEPSVKLLIKCAFLSTSPISQEMLKAGLEGSAREDLDNALEVLRKKDLAFITSGNGGRSIIINAQISSFVREQLSNTPFAQQEAIEQALFMIIESLEKLDGDSTQNDLSFEHMIYPHLAQCLEYAEQVENNSRDFKSSLKHRHWSTLGAVCEHEGDYRNSATLFTKAFRIILDETGLEGEDSACVEPRVIDLLNAGSCAGASLIEQEHFDDAELIYTETIDAISLHSDLENLDNLKQEMITKMLVFLDRSAEARILYQSILVNVEKSEGVNSFEALRVVEILASSYNNIRMYHKSEPLFKRELISLERRVGPCNPRVVRVHRALAEIYSKQNNFDEARTQLRLAIDANNSRLGEEHPKTLEIIADLAFLLSCYDKFTESHELFDTVIGSERRILGDGHPIYLRTMERLADSYRMEGRIDDAKKLRMEVLTLKSKTLADNDPEIKVSIWKIANLHQVEERRRVVRLLRSVVSQDPENSKDDGDFTTDSQSFLGTSREPSELHMSLSEHSIAKVSTAGD